MIWLTLSVAEFFKNNCPIGQGHEPGESSKKCDKQASVSISDLCRLVEDGL